MARNIKSNIFEFNGTLGNVIGYKWNGIQCYRKKPIHVKNPKTPKQVAQRNRFKAFNQFAKKCMDKVLKQIWKRCTAEMTGYNLFIKTNMGLINEQGKVLDYNNLILSVGELPLPSEFEIESKVDGNCVITINWENDDRKDYFNPDDRLKITAIINSEIVQVMGLTARRKDKTATFQLPCGSGTPIHLYVYFYDEDTMDGSPSYYQLVEVPN